MDLCTPIAAVGTNNAFTGPQAEPFPLLTFGQVSDTTTEEAYTRLSNALNGLTGKHDMLLGQTTQATLSGPERGSSQNVKEFRQRLDKDLEHEGGTKTIQNIIDQILQDEGDNMRKQFNQEIASQIDEVVDIVDKCLKDHFTEDLLLKLEEDKREYEHLQLALHNSESRRLNGFLRANRPDELLSTIYTSNGLISPRFPKDLRGLFSLDADTLKALMADYDVHGASDGRNSNINKFMQFCGVRYQMIRSNNRKDNNTTRAN